MNEGNNQAALNQLDRIPLVAEERKEADRLIARLNLQGGAAQDESSCAPSSSPNRTISRPVRSGSALAGSEKYEEALAEFLTIIKTDRSFRDDGARKATIQIFEVWDRPSVD